VKRLTITKDSVNEVVRGITALVGKRVLVGFPESSTHDSRGGEEPTNATLGYIHEYGSPAANIPARPFLIPGVEKSEEASVAMLRKAVEFTLDGKPAHADEHLNKAGLLAVNSAKHEISTADFVPLKPATVRSRKYSRQTKSRRKSEIEYLRLVKGGMSPADAQSATGIQPLINTGQLRNAITYVIRKVRSKA
jgi:hypothetical protein